MHPHGGSIGRWPCVHKRQPNIVSQLGTLFQRMVAGKETWGPGRRLGVCLTLGDGGASRDRTDDLIVANDALSQLSYSPLGLIADRQAILPAFLSGDYERGTAIATSDLK
jgi:hypothetical protein